MNYAYPGWSMCMDLASFCVMMFKVCFQLVQHYCSPGIVINTTQAFVGYHVALSPHSESDLHNTMVDSRANGVGNMVSYSKTEQGVPCEYLVAVISGEPAGMNR